MIDQVAAQGLKLAYNDYMNARSAEVGMLYGNFWREWFARRGFPVSGQIYSVQVPSP